MLASEFANLILESVSKFGDGPVFIQPTDSKFPIHYEVKTPSILTKEDKIKIFI